MPTGNIVQSPEIVKRGQKTLVSAIPAAPWRGMDLSSAMTGSKTDTQPVNEPANAKVGNHGHGFGFADWYERIHINPSPLDLGVIVGDMNRDVRVWNAYFQPVTLQSLLASNADDLILTQPGVTPLVYGPLQERTYTVGVDDGGPPIIDASYQFTFDVGVSILSVIGTRAVVFPFAPNWSNPVSETLEWKTDVLKSHDGSEQRRSLRVVPRRGFEYQILLSGDEPNRLEMLLWGWQHQNFAVPVWTDKTKLTADAAIGDTVIQVPTDTFGFRSGDLCILYHDSFTYEVAQVVAFTSSTITLRKGLRSNWLAGMSVYPVITAHLPTSVSVQRHTDSVVSGAVVFTTSPDQVTNNLPDTAAPTMYDGYEVLTVKPNWRDTINNEFTRLFNTVDSGVGPINYYSTEKFTTTTKGFAWFIKSRAEMVAFRAFINRLRGRAKTCWVPSWHKDFEVAVSTPATSQSLIVKGTDFANLIGYDTSRDRVAIRLANGSVLYRRITAAPSVSGENTILALDTQHGVTINPGEVRVNLLLRCRLAADKVEIPWRTTTFAEPQTPFITVKL